MVSIDAYVQNFLYILEQRLGTVVEFPKQPVELIPTFIALMLFNETKGCGLRDRIMVNFVGIYKKFFSGNSCIDSHRGEPTRDK